MQKTTLVLGASDNVERYSNLAIKKLVAYNNQVIAVGRKKASVGNVSIETIFGNYENLDTITLYLSPENQKPYYNNILEIGRAHV